MAQGEAQEEGLKGRDSRIRDYRASSAISGGKEIPLPRYSKGIR